MTKEIKIIFDELNEKPIVYHRIYSKITKSITAGLLLSQLIYWAKKMKYEEFYKTDNDFSEELGMGLYELKGAKKKLLSLKLITIKRKGIPAKTYYSVDIDAIITLITSCGKNPQLDGGKTHNKSKEKPTTITENTTENTTEIISKDITKQSFGNPLINSFIKILLISNDISTLDGTVKENRNYANLFIKNKLKPEFRSRTNKEATDEELENSLKTILKRTEGWHKSKLTNFKYLYYNFVAILQETKNNNNKLVKII